MERGRPVSVLSREIRRRWTQLWRGEYDAETLRSVPSWGLSVLLHAVLLLILAFLIQLGRGAVRPESSFQGAVVETQLGELVSLVDAPRAGDPFTLTDSPDPPSLGLEPADARLKLV